jgi:hypothetical protein
VVRPILVLLRWKIKAKYMPNLWRWIVLALAAIAAYPMWHWRGVVLDSLSDVSSLLLVFAGLWFAMSPSQATALEQNRTTRMIVGIGLALVGGVGLVSGYYDKKATKDTLKQLTAASATQATQKDIQGLRGDIGELRTDTKNGFDGVINAINTLGDRLVGKSYKPSPKPKIPEKAPEIEKPPVREHILYAPKDVPAGATGPAYAKQVIVQTDQNSQPTVLQVEADKEIKSGRFFIAGQPVMMNVRTRVSGNTFTLGFGYPAFTPENPVVVTLLSDQQLEIKSVKRIDSF